MTRRVTGADGREWTVRELWLPPLRGLPPDPDLDSARTPFGLVLALPLYVLRLAWSSLRALFGLVFQAPWIVAEHLGPPYSRLTWRANDRHVGPRVIEQVAAALERGDRRIAVEGASFLGFATRPNSE